MTYILKNGKIVKHETLMLDLNDEQLLEMGNKWQGKIFGDYYEFIDKFVKYYYDDYEYNGYDINDTTYQYDTFWTTDTLSLCVWPSNNENDIHEFSFYTIEEDILE